MNGQDGDDLLVGLGCGVLFLLVLAIIVASLMWFFSHIRWI